MGQTPTPTGPLQTRPAPVSSFSAKQKRPLVPGARKEPVLGHADPAGRRLQSAPSPLSLAPRPPGADVTACSPEGSLARERGRPGRERWPGPGSPGTPPWASPQTLCSPLHAPARSPSPSSAHFPSDDQCVLGAASSQLC